MPRYFIEVQYDGTAFHGSQIQGQQITVQWALNQALSTLLRQNIETLGASRTDEGVHALCNFYHFDWPEMLQQKCIYNLNALLPHSMSVKQLYKSNSEDANARFEAINREYRYKIYIKKNPFAYKRAYLFPYHLDLNSLQQTASVLLAYNDFETFCKRNAQNKTYKCTLYKSEWQEQGDEIHYVVCGNRFLRGMVRALVGTQLRVLRNNKSLADFREIIESKDCARADFSVPGYGLYLEKINYPEGLIVPVSK